MALDGNPVAAPRPVEVLAMGPGERVDAIVEMNRPGIWILGATKDDDRNDGMGILVEYANQHGDPQWVARANINGTTPIFGPPAARSGARPDD